MESEVSDGGWASGVRRLGPGTWRDAEPQITRLGQTGDGDSENRDALLYNYYSSHDYILFRVF